MSLSDLTEKRLYVKLYKFLQGFTPEIGDILS